MQNQVPLNQIKNTTSLQIILISMLAKDSDIINLVFLLEVIMRIFLIKNVSEKSPDVSLKKVLPGDNLFIRSWIEF